MISVVTMTVRPEGLKPVREALLKQTFRDFEWLVDINWTGEVDFNQATNRLLKRASGELIVFVQDYVELPEHGLQSFWEAHEQEPAFYTAPVGHYDSENIRWDWRTKRTGTTKWQEWEIDCGSAPRAALVEIGGFDEELDRAWGFDNVNVALRADLKGYKFYCLPEIRAKAWDHNTHRKHEFKHLRDEDFANTRLEFIKQDVVDINYLQN